MNTEQTPFRSGFVSIIGRPNVGKSTLLNRILGQKIAIASPKPQTTRNRILGIHNLDDGQILFLDTPGIHRATGKLNRYMVDQAMAACSDVDVVLFLIEATDRPGGGDDFILDVLSRSSVPVILVINKIDKVSPGALLPLIEIYAQKRDFAAIIPISGMTGSGVDALIKATHDLLPSGPRYYPEDMVTDLPERFIVAEMIREQILKQVRDEVPYGVAVVVESFTEKPEKNIVVIAAAILVERDPHKKIILGKGGEKIRSIGKAARVDIEKMLGTRVYLELFVKVQKNWTESDKLLKDFGYE
ncbi:GTPase Era [Desulfuromonas sp. AOP6]|uniref:GTPase Era n=1 Tax=Desulfuromonas sp. AOP6 TaxID=1566351 RepID=UPI0012773A29|nr:GTPase Era [Desulfuromonas sp. AOP6]BCA80025.1 GTPase Era [Desulfuromonas sp. AOP6]